MLVVPTIEFSTICCVDAAVFITDSVVDDWRDDNNAVDRAFFLVSNDNLLVFEVSRLRLDVDVADDDDDDDNNDDENNGVRILFLLIIHPFVDEQVVIVRCRCCV
jgi:hypothetical protein